MAIYNVYCDESCHLPNDRKPKMVLGAIWCPLERVRAMSDALRALKKQHGLSPQMEVKWTKVSPAKVDFYLALVDFFFNQADLRFRALVVEDKSKLDHKAFEQDHDTWYYKMYYSMLEVIITPDDRFRIYLDIKDTRSADRMRKLHEVLCNNIHDFDHNVIERVQTVRSHEVELLQLADLLIGAVRYVGTGPRGFRGLGRSAKDQVVLKFELQGRLSSLQGEQKVGILHWGAQETAW